MSSEMQNLISDFDDARERVEKYLEPHIKPFLALLKETGKAYGDIENLIFNYNDHDNRGIYIYHASGSDWETHTFQIPYSYFDNPLLYAEAERAHLTHLQQQRIEQEKKAAQKTVERLRKELAEAEAKLDNSQKAN